MRAMVMGWVLVLIAGTAWAELLAPSDTALAMPEVSKEEWDMFEGLLTEMGIPLKNMTREQQDYAKLMLRHSLASIESQPDEAQAFGEDSTALVVCGDAYAGFNALQWNDVISSISIALAERAALRTDHAAGLTFRLPNLDRKACEARVDEIRQRVDARVEPLNVIKKAP